MSSMTEKWEKSLASKLRVDIRPEFDQQFWAKFEQQFREKETIIHKENKGTAAIPWWSWSFNFAWATCLVIALTYQVGKFNQQMEKENSKIAFVMKIAPALESIEAYSELDDLNLTEEEWEILNGKEVI